MKKINLTLSVLFAVLLWVPANLFAQSFKVSGTVSDKDGAVVGASVIVQGTSVGASTDAAGAFELTVPGSPAVLEVSYIGYKPQQLPVTAAMSNLRIVLEEDAQTLEDVVVLGFGAAARRADLSTSVGVLDNVEANKARPVSTIENMLQGQMPGVTIVAQGGDPTATPSVTVRGVGSQSGESVLWVVDGVPNAPLNINDIESMVVLKDAASAAIYGAQSGAAGVILVTTKKAKAGGVSVSYDGTYGVRQATNLPQSLTVEEERAVRTKGLAVNGLSLPTLWDSPEMSQTRTDWMDEVFRTALFQRHQVSVQGGTDRFANRVSFNYANEEGTLQSTFNKTASLRYNGNYKVTDWLTISEDFMYSNNKSRGTNTDSGYQGVIWLAMSMPRSARAYYDDGSFGGTSEIGSDVAGLHGDQLNPLRVLNAHSEINKRQKMSSTTNLTIANILPGLKFNSRFTYRNEDLFFKKFTPRTTEPGKPVLTNTLEYQSSDFYFWETENALTYDNTFGRHTVGALFATTASKQRGRSFWVVAHGLENESDIYQYLNNATEFENPEDSFDSPDNNVALVGRLSYSFDDRYFVTASWRRDYAGRLPAGHKSADFPAVTGAWKISSEPFFAKNDVVTLLKLRASWGRIGNLGSIGYAYGAATLGIYNKGNDRGQVAGQPNNNRVYPVSRNLNLSWETSEQTDLGLDIDMFRGRLSIGADVYWKRTYDLIQSQTMGWPDAMGLGAPTLNLGEIRNRGFELSVTWKDQVNKDWSYYVNGNFSVLKNWVSDIGVRNEDGSKAVWSHGGYFRGQGPIYQTAEGEPLYSYYLIKSAGIFQSDEEAAAYVDKDGNRIQPSAKAGDLKFIDKNGDGKIDSEDRFYLGSYMPKMTFALSAGFTWKDLSFGVMLQGAARSKAFNATKFTYLNEAEGLFNRSRDILGAWSPENRGSDIPRINSQDPNGNFTTMSDWYLEDASYLRIKNVSVAYDLSRLLRRSRHFASRNSSLSVYFSAENLYTFTNYSGMDPEVGGWGLDSGKYPVSRVMSFGIRLTY
ncbi:MAG: TonB-dependent receptor [Alistipes sp.]|nr:TonB-dependent receptor [Alistipes sp.]